MPETKELAQESGGIDESKKLSLEELKADSSKPVNSQDTLKKKKKPKEAVISLRYSNEIDAELNKICEITSLPKARIAEMGLQMVVQAFQASQYEVRLHPKFDAKFTNL